VRVVVPLGERKLAATVEVPGSKSYTQRALVVASLAEGESVLKNALLAEDSHYLIEALRILGVHIEEQGKEITVRGTGGRLAETTSPLFLGNNGTALRFLTSFVSLGQGKYLLTGEKRLCERPIKPLLDALSSLGVRSKTRDNTGYPPVEIYGGGLRGGEVIFGDIESSQYVSSLLIVAPYAEGDVRITLKGRVVSEPYIEMTRETMGKFGVLVTKEAEGQYFIKSGQTYCGREYVVEGDCSSASYFFLAAALCGGSVRVENINPFSLQGDIRFLEILETLGCHCERGENWVTLKGGVLRKGDFTFDLSSMPDMVPTLAVLAALREGRTEIVNVAHLRVKESNRLAALARELNKLGINAEETQTGLIVFGGRPQGTTIETYNDHRIAMSFGMLGLVVPGMKILNPDCVKKSFPTFWVEMEKLYGR